MSDPLPVVPHLGVKVSDLAACGPCIIAENDDHIIVAVPIARATIAQYQPFLAALRATGARPDVPASGRDPITRRSTC
jgi:hypothetical protein